MNKTTKILLSLVGIGAVVIPAILLKVLTSKVGDSTSTPSVNRSIDPGAFEGIIDDNTPPAQTVIATPTPKPASPSAQPIGEGSPSAQ